MPRLYRELLQVSNMIRVLWVDKADGTKRFKAFSHLGSATNEAAWLSKQGHADVRIVWRGERAW